jgi:hypothetical protein
VELYNLSVDSFNLWVEQMKGYLSCVEREAKGDIENVGRVIVDGARREVEDAKFEIARTRSNLLIQRPLR